MPMFLKSQGRVGWGEGVTVLVSVGFRNFSDLLVSLALLSTWIPSKLVCEFYLLGNLSSLSISLSTLSVNFEYT